MSQTRIHYQIPDSSLPKWLFFLCRLLTPWRFSVLSVDVVFHSQQQWLPKLGGQPRNDSIDTDLWSLIEGFLTFGFWTLTHVSIVPVLCDAGFAVVVSTRNADHISESITTDGAQELLLWVKAGTRHFYTRRTKSTESVVVLECYFS